jgi:pyridine nucleotide-disulfide oxidoreductase family protein
MASKDPEVDRRVILAGGGHAHLAVLADWARRPLPGAERVLVTSRRHLAYSGMVPGWLAGIYRADELLIDLAPLAEQAGARLILADVTGLNADHRRLTLSSGEALEFDLLSLATGGEIETAGLAALGERLLPVRPVDGFMTRWTQLLEAQTPGSRIAVVGGGAAGVELALAVEAGLRRRFGEAQVALVTPEEGLLAGHNAGVKRRALAELAARGIALHLAEAGGELEGLRLSNDRLVSTDCVIAATGSRPPRWLAASGLARTAQGFAAIGADLRSVSHPAVFAAGDIAQRGDRPLPRAGVHAVKGGPVLAANLRAVLAGTGLKPYQPGRYSLSLLATGEGRAILSWGPFAASGRWVWRLKDWIDRGFVSRYTDDD